MKKNRPSIKDLQDFTNKYFKNPPIVKWRVEKGIDGWVLCDKKVICINPNSDLKDYKVMDHWAEDITKSLLEGEQYFVTLLHEIGHVKLKRPKYWLKLREKIIKKYPNDEEKQVCSIPDYLKRRDNEKVKDYVVRMAKFEDLLLSGKTHTKDDAIFYTIPERENILYQTDDAYGTGIELEVEKWSQKEFMRRRKAIRKILGP